MEATAVDEQRQQLLALWKAIGALSQSAALALSGMIATWSFCIGLTIWIVRDPKVWTDWRISIFTLLIDLIMIMVSVINTRVTFRQADTMLAAMTQVTAEAHIARAAQRRIDKRLARIEAKLGLVVENEGGETNGGDDGDSNSGGD